MFQIGSSLSEEIVRVDNDFSFLDDIKKFNAEIAEQFEERATELRRYAALMENHFDLMDDHGRLKLFAQLSYGKRRAAEAVSWVLYLKRKVSKKIKYCKAIAAHENFYKYIEDQSDKGVKITPTDGNKKWYVDMDKDVLHALDEEAIIDAMYEQFFSLKMEFIQGESSLRSLYFGAKDSDYMSNAAVNIELEKRDE